MSTPPLSDEVLIATVELFEKHGRHQTRAAEAANLSRGALQERLKQAAKRGLMGTKPVLPGFRISQTSAVTNEAGEIVREFIQQRPEAGGEFAVPDGHSIKGLSALVDSDGRTVQTWFKTRAGEYDPRTIAEWLKASFDDYEPAAKPAKPPAAPVSDLLTLFPANDWHVGLSAWGKQVGVNWDLKIAEDIIGGAVEDTMARSPSSGLCIVLGGGDLIHADNKSNQTTAGTPQDVDGRYPKIVQVATRLMVRAVDAALAKHQHVIVRVLPGNHDEHSSVAVAYFLLAWYRNEPRVTVDTDPSLFFWHLFGSVLIGATHGHTVKIEKMPGIMAHRRPEDWGASKFRYVHGFHLHHSAKIATEGNGVICEVHQAPVPQDAWHFGSGYLSGRSLQAITYHKTFGEIGRVRVAMLDADITEVQQ